MNAAPALEADGSGGEASDTIRALPLLYRFAFALSRRSVAAKALSVLGLSKYLDDRTSTLASSPLGMFFYNQRFVFFGAGFIYITVLAVAAFVAQTREAVVTVAVVFTAWAIAVGVTLFWHRRFLANVATHVHAASLADFPPVFYPYVILDCVLVLALVLVGNWVFAIDLHFFAFLLLANTIVYCACAGAYVGARRSEASIPVLLVIFLSALVIGTAGMRGSAFVAMRDMGPVLGMAAVAVLAVAIVSAVRQREHWLMHAQVEMLGRLEEALGGAGSYRLEGREGPRETPKDVFERRLRRALKTLTTGNDAFWYRSARIWFVDERQGDGSYLLPGPFCGTKAFVAQPDTLAISPELLSWTDIHIVPNSRVTAALPAPIRSEPSVGDEPAAHVPVLLRNGLGALLSFYGVPHDPATAHHQRTFLRSAASIVADTLEQADVRHSSAAQEAIDELFRRDSLAEALPRAASIFMKFTRAQGCILATRAASDRIDVAASTGFAGPVRSYSFAEGPVADAALRGIAFAMYRDEIAPSLRLELETLHRHPVTSCLIVPFHASGHPYGAIVLINSAGRAPWFSKADGHLCRRLAHTVGRLVEKFLQMESTQRSLQLARDQEEQAKIAMLNAQTAALQRQDDLMVMTHQLQAPLNSMRGSVLRLQRQIDDTKAQKSLQHVHGLIDDSLALCWGTVTSFAKEAGRPGAFDIQDVDALSELQSLAHRVQRTNARDDVIFEFVAEARFPPIRIDRAVFTSVFYSLVHNAMKYADKGSKVIMECGFERAKGVAALKVKSIGEPIHPDERDRIFEKYKRGRVVTSTGRYHAGVGLGLWVARQLMRDVGGEIVLELSAELPRLAIFVVTCPVAGGVSE